MRGVQNSNLPWHLGHKSKAEIVPRLVTLNQNQRVYQRQQSQNLNQPQKGRWRGERCGQLARAQHELKLERQALDGTQ